VNFVPTIVKNFIARCLGRTDRSAPITTTIAAAEIVSATGSNAPASASLSAEAQWQRVSAVVERSIQRAQGIGEQQSAARQQLDAAEYTLHRLIEELNEVMTSSVQLPKPAEVAAVVPAQAFVQSLAA
jgi:hypothetical protein